MKGGFGLEIRHVPMVVLPDGSAMYYGLDFQVSFGEHENCVM